MTAALLDARLRAKYFSILLQTVKMNGAQFENDERVAALLYRDAGGRPDIAKRILKDVLDTAFYRLQLERTALQERILELHATPLDEETLPPFPSLHGSPLQAPASANTPKGFLPLPSSPRVRFLEPIDSGASEFAL